ncbi:hypothetical protein J6590_027796 [Homalodisca vitripennis]|nr:hypothetical protein J6590_027796 [Homalodisca vitripennis]
MDIKLGAFNEKIKVEAKCIKKPMGEFLPLRKLHSSNPNRNKSPRNVLFIKQHHSLRYRFTV